MLPKSLQAEIEARTHAQWQLLVSLPQFASLVAGKEFGHRIADWVDDETVAFLKQHYALAVEVSDKRGSATRSMGDAWFLHDGIYHPINIKAGDADKSGQPNMVSMTKLVTALLKGEIDSYYLLSVKFHLVTTEVDVEMVDMLDHLAYLHYDAGPGQIMLKQKLFRARPRNGTAPPLTLEAKIDHLLEMGRHATESLVQLRAKRMEELSIARSAYQAGKPVCQTDLVKRLQPL